MTPKTIVPQALSPRHGSEAISQEQLDDAAVATVLAVFPGSTPVACRTCGSVDWHRVGTASVCVVCHPPIDR